MYLDFPWKSDCADKLPFMVQGFSSIIRIVTESKLSATASSGIKVFEVYVNPLDD